LTFYHYPFDRGPPRALLVTARGGGVRGPLRQVVGGLRQPGPRVVVGVDLPAEVAGRDGVFGYLLAPGEQLLLHLDDALAVAGEVGRVLPLLRLELRELDVELRHLVGVRAHLVEAVGDLL